MANAEALVDIELLDETADLGLDDMCDLLELYLDQSTEIMQSIHTAIQQNHATEVRELSHRLAGSCAACGASGAMNTLRKLEQCGRENNLANADELFADTVDQLLATQQFLADFLRPRGASLRGAFVPPKSD